MSGHALAQPHVYRVGLALRSVEVEAVVFDLPGCQCTGHDEAFVRARLPVVVAEHIAWLDQHGDVTRDAFPLKVEVVEEVDVATLQDVADGEFCYEDDLRPAGREDVETAIRRMGYARQDLLAVVRHLPEAVLDWQPPAAAVKVDEWAPEIRSIRGILQHIAGADGYYARNVGAAPVTGSLGTNAAPDLFEQRHHAVEHLRSLSGDDLGSLFERRQPWQTEGAEHWTVRKALRRLISHERFHTKEIEQRLAWLLIDAPELADVRAGSVP